MDKPKTSDELFPIQVIDEDSTRYKVRYAVFTMNGSLSLMLLTLIMMMKMFLVAKFISIDFLFTMNSLLETAAGKSLLLSRLICHLTELSSMVA